MNKRVLLIVASSIIIMVIAGLLIATSVPGKAYPGVQQTKETDEIQKVIEASYAIEAKAGRDFDTSKFQDAFINDTRGGELSQSTVEFIESVDANHKASYGYLDYKLAYFSWWEKGALQLETLFAKVKNENRKMTKDEMRSLFDQKGRLAMPRLKGESTKKNLSFDSIEIKGDTAVAIFDDGPRTNQMILVKVENQWFIAGNKILSVHP